ncbi:tripartite tricarboxylate transporter substrate binding protein [Roseomonas sp. NAR14]|uniref:Tripartite tricarboxylate transporter substrate binding protein n=1 Tax=Roseomonas acroporae TaxID=2937791 RepID=A0A9X1Y9G5_9PROT|nr:tripartite tricarboxylate transporter substrate binding protein [Roseomonas acroporae]MCK8785545.1 tripartite tricarboxylate transporter substrate binding protein [Roseomonas acroporae]
MPRRPAMPCRRSALRLALAALLAAPARPGVAQEYPAQPLRLVIPFAPGGTNDIVGRLVTEGMGVRLGQPFVVENRGGAGGLMGAEVVSRAAPDGYTLLLGGSGSLTINSLMNSRSPFDAATAFAPIGLIGAGDNVIVVWPGLPARSLRELQALARRSAVPLSYGSPGVGSTGHVAGAMVAEALGVPMTHVPYRGTGPAMNDLLAGRIQVFTNALAPLQPAIEAGTLRALAIAGPRRNPALPTLPTTAEAGFPQIEAATWFGLFAPAGTAPDRVARLHAALNATLAEPATARRLREGGLDVTPSASPADFAEFYAADRARWAGVVARASLRSP